MVNEMPWLFQYEFQDIFGQWQLFKQECTDEAFNGHLLWLAHMDPTKIRNILAARLPLNS